MRQRWTDPAAIEAEIARICSLPIDALRRRWRVMFGRTPPAALGEDLLGQMVAARLQEQAFGSLDRESLRFLDGLARHGGARRRQLKPGTVHRCPCKPLTESQSHEWPRRQARALCDLYAQVDRVKLDLAFNSLDAQREACEATSRAKRTKAGG